MIDMHMHTLYSDGDKTVEELLKICEKNKLEYISITDHNNIKQYDDPALLNSFFGGKIIKGLEMDAIWKNRKIEILAYNIKNKDVIDNWNQKFFSKEKLQKTQDEVRKKLLRVCDKNGLIYNKDNIKKDIPLTDYISVYIYQELIKHEQNIPILGELAESLAAFIRKGLLNPESEYCTILNDMPQPMYKEVIDTIHQAGGLAFLAHPFEYRFDNTIQFIDTLRAEKELDGIECFHPSANEDQMQILEEYANTHNLFISGGSDYHGSKKPDVNIAVGKGNLNISKSYVEKWITN